MTTPPPDSGADRFRDHWVPVPLLEKVYDRDSRTYRIKFEAPKQLLLNSQWEALVHDELLRNADRDGLVIEGQVNITTEDKGVEKAPQPPTEDGTVDRDAQVREVLMDPAKEVEVEIEQDALETPFKMSEAEKQARRRLRQGLRETAEEAFGFVSRSVGDDAVIGEKKFQVDRDAFLEGFYGAPVAIPKVDVMVVTAEAFVGLALDVTAEEPAPDLVEPAITETDHDRIVAETEIPDDLSGLDG